MVMNKTVGTSWPPFGLFVPNLKVVKKKIWDKLTKFWSVCPKFLGMNFLKLGQIDQSETNWLKIWKNWPKLGRIGLGQIGSGTNWLVSSQNMCEREIMAYKKALHVKNFNFISTFHFPPPKSWCSSPPSDYLLYRTWRKKNFCYIYMLTLNF